MTRDTFFVQIEKETGKSLFAFTRSETGMMDYAGKVESADLSSMQVLESSRYFTPSWYTYLPQELLANITVYIPENIEDFDANQYSFLAHIGAILLAVEAKDALLIAELLHRRETVFSSFIPILLHVIKPVAAEALFAWVYGTFRGEENFPEIYKKNKPITLGETNTTAILFAAARDALQPEPEKESAKEMFIRYFKQKKPFEFTIGLVGSSCHPWVEGVSRIEALSDKAAWMHLVDNPLAAGKKHQELYASLKSTVQAEPYNPHDHNAISVSIDSVDSILKGIPGKCKAGYIRATGAEILRKARPNQFAYKSSLWRMGATPSFFENGIVVKIGI